MRESCSGINRDETEQLNEIFPPTLPCSGPKIETRNNNNSDNNIANDNNLILIIIATGVKKC